MRTTNTQKLKLGMQKVEMDGPIIDYIRISDNPLTRPQKPFYTQFGLKKYLFLLNFSSIMWFFWDLWLPLFDIAKNVVFPENLVISSIFGFLGVNWVPKWTKTVNFRCVPIDSKFKLLKDFSNTVLVLLEEYLWSKFQQDWTIFGKVRPNTTKKGSFHVCWINTKN